MAGEKIMFVDDEALITRLVTTYFRRCGYSVTTATDGLQALVAIAADRPDLLITDVQMPNMDGLELTSRLRADPLTAQLPIVILSSHNDIDDTLAGYVQGADAYVPKPVELVVLGARVEVLLGRTNGSQQSSASPPSAWSSTFDTATVLVVEDDPTVRLLESSLLRHAGYVVVEASTGEQALALVSESPPDLVVLDVSLPSISGLEVLHTLAADERTQDIPVLVVSSYVPLIGAEHRPAMAATLTKPFDPSEFLSVVEALVEAEPGGPTVTPLPGRFGR